MNRDLIKWVLILMAITFVFKMNFTDSDDKSNEKNSVNYTNIDYSKFTDEVANHKINKVDITDAPGYQYKIIAQKDAGNSYVLYVPYNLGGSADFTKMLHENEVAINFKEKEADSFWSVIGAQLLHFGMLFLFMYIIFNMATRRSGNGVMGMLKHKGKVIISNTKFSDVAGNKETIEEVREIVDFLKSPEHYFELGAKIPTGLLMSGPPGTGKTLLAKAVAGEANVPFIALSGSDFVELFAGLAASRVRALFKEARENAPCIIFIDEIDALGKSRTNNMGGGNDEREQALNQLLVEMDGIGTEKDKPVIVIAATNRPDQLDQALLRPGRFDRQVSVGLPDLGTRKRILNIHAKNIKVSDNVDWTKIAKGTPGFSGADLANLCNEAALTAGRAGHKEIETHHIEEAKDKILMGVRHGFVMSDTQKSLTAYHEAGHTIIGWVKHQLDTHDPVYKVSIIPRGRALGVTIYTPESDRVSYSREEIKASITTLYGGRIAEAMMVGEEKTTTGASNDIERATELAYNYVTKWGLDGHSLSKNDSKVNGIGPVYYSRHEKHIDGRERLLSDHDLETIDLRVRKLLDECYTEACKILEDNKEELIVMHNMLMEKETIDADEVHAIMDNKNNI